MNRMRDDGYALTEVLVAGAIASAVIIAVMGGLSLSARGGNRADLARQDAFEASNISARLRAGMEVRQIADAYPDWRIEILPYERPVDPATGAVLTRARLIRRHSMASDFVLDLVYLEAGSRLQESGGEP